MKAPSLSTRKEFNFVFKRGYLNGSKYLSVRSVSTSRDVTRVSYMIPTNIGIAVVRNKIRRRLREAVRALPVQAGFDVVIMVRKEVLDANYQELAEDLKLVFIKARVVKKEKS